ncbi:MAG: hypothetical protein IR164_05720 [Devosia sp.]|uniref:hypothetical protein n=1 Tax=Devosia sp. TaxID=1871048 RepID=UPI0019FE9581|nr:hypothetical protein [Devosia sp.]MBF0678424.1 hypothetical protein [Devosia sp.]
MRLFGTRVWGFGFTRRPLATFGAKGHVDSLLRKAQRGDRLVFVGTQTDRTDPSNRGRILGMGEFGFESLSTLDLVDRTDLDPRDFDANGQFKFPYAVPMIRAWAFDPAPRLMDTIKEQMSMAATSGFEEIDDPEDVAAILALKAVSVDLPTLPALERMRRLNDALRPTTGPRPGEGGTFEVTRITSGDHWTYGLRYGKRDVWKIGYSVDVNGRVESINQHIPIELGIEAWTPVYRQKMQSAGAAYRMEQRVLELLAAKRSGFERVRCTQSELQTAWQQAFLDVIKGD